jgi:iduronate 2-sulfatase
MKQLVVLAAMAFVGSALARQNVLLLCIDDLRPELASFGADYIQSPNIDRLAETGRAFHCHYVNAPSCGPSRCTLLTGRYGAAGNQALFQRAKQMAEEPDLVPPSMPEWFRKHGYTTVSVGKVSHHPGGRGGKDWNDESSIEMPGAWSRHLMPVGEWQHPRGAMHGLAHGEIRGKKKTMKAIQSADGPDTIYPDGLIADEGMAQLKQLAATQKPFFLAIGLIKPHLPFGAPKEYMASYDGVELPPIPHPEKPSGTTTWHGSGEFFGQYDHGGKDPRKDAAYADEVRRHYAACVTYADKHVGDILATLKETGAENNTIVVLWGDHGWHLGEHSIWGKHSLFEESLRSPLIIKYPGMGMPGEQTDAVVASLDIFPTLCELAKLPMPDFSQGESLMPMLENPKISGHVAIGYTGGALTIRDERWRMTKHKDGPVELYDHASPEMETRNVADQYPDVIAKLTAQLDQRMN